MQRWRRREDTWLQAPAALMSQDPLVQHSSTLPVDKHVSIVLGGKAKAHRLLYKRFLPCDSREKGSDKPVLSLPGSHQRPQQQTGLLAVF